MSPARPQPTLSRRHEGGAPGARSLLLTVLGELVLPTGGSAWTASFIDVLGRQAVEEKATRQAIMRTAAAGWLRSTREGRRTRWSLTPAGSRLLTEGAARIYGFTSADEAWDGRWLVVLARVPETDRQARHLLRSRLSWAGLGAVAPGTWISPHPDRQAEVEQVLGEAGVTDAHCFVARHTLGDAHRMVRDAWDVDAMAEAYTEFVARFATGEDDDVLRRQVDLVHRWRRFPQIAPTLPRDLLPADWPGDRASDLFRERHDGWSAPALEAWRTLDAG
ncbi:PaaX family transcriptional regulator [Jatrophihabitans sp. YIM 134969]